jgi:hypothetical protein
MTTHVKVLGVLFLAFSALSLLIAAFIFLAIGTAAGIVGVAADPHDAALTIPILGLAGSAVGIVLLLLALPGLVTGWGLLNFKPWARILGIVLAAINLVNFPFGTALGVYGLWVLLNKDTERLFEPSAPITA